jgi:hypothetical protein
VKNPEREENESPFPFRKSFSQKRELQPVHIGGEKIPRMRNSGLMIAERNFRA